MTQWTSVYTLACAWASAELGREGVAALTWPYLEALTQTSPKAAARIALKAVGLGQHAAHLNDLLTHVPSQSNELDCWLQLSQTLIGKPRDRHTTGRAPVGPATAVKRAVPGRQRPVPPVGRRAGVGRRS